MSLGVAIAAIERAGDHAAVLGVLALVAVVGGVVYGLVHLVKRRAGRSRPDPGPEGVRDPEAAHSDRAPEHAQDPAARGPAA